MAANDWINSYLEAILDVGPGIGDGIRTEDQKSSSLLLRERGNFSPTKYFVEEVITGFDETDIHRSWMKAAATKGPQDQNTRLENMCWRIWHLARKKKQIECEETQGFTKHLLEHEQSCKDATEDMSEDLSEGEKSDVVNDMYAHGYGQRKSKLSRINSVDVIEAWANQEKEKKLYIVLISLHGLVRGYNMELGRDSDTGGQVKYVVELARALALMPEVYRVDLLTRQICSPEVDSSYGEISEMLTLGTHDGYAQVGENSGAYIIRIPFGPKDKYICKEFLWPHIQEFVDGALSHVLIMSKILGEEIGGGQPIWPYVIHGHYADAGDASSLLSGALNVPMVFTGHSLGRNKLEQLLKQGRQSIDEINATYKIMRRIEAEELSLDASELIITSTRQEIEEQWGLYDGFDVKLERVLRARAKSNVSSHGRYMPCMVVIPPGMEFNVAEHENFDTDGDTDVNGDASAPLDPPIWAEVRFLFNLALWMKQNPIMIKIMRFFTNPRKPMILALARPDPKKNMTTLVKSFGESRPLRELANLTLIMGNRDDIDGMSSGNAAVLTTILKLIDKYDLYGQVAYPKHHKQSDVPDIYRLAAKTKGVFINPALVEPFGLTLIEAAAHGLPIVATQNGGPVDIHRVLDNGLLVDPHDQKAIAEALLRLLADKQLWLKCRQNGLKNIHLFSWPEHCKTYLSRIALCRIRHPQWQDTSNIDESVDLDSQGDSLRDIQDITLKFSLDGEKDEEGGSLDTAPDVEEGVVNDEYTSVNTPVACKEIWRELGDPSEKDDQNNNSNRFPLLRRRNRLFVIAVDYYNPEDKGTGLLGIVKEVIKASHLDPMSGTTGFILSTALTISEIQSLLASWDMNLGDFDAFICSSGSEIYYTGSSNTDDITIAGDSTCTIDLDYVSHIDYRWGGEGLRKTMVQWAESVAKKGEKAEGGVLEDKQRCNEHCVAFQIKDPTVVPTVEKIRKQLRVHGLRCHVIYCHKGSKLHVIPLLASRSQALRYLFTRWGVEVTNMFVFIGETGDSDYEELLGGLHKTVILKGTVDNGCENLLRSNSSYVKEDVVPLNSHNIVMAEEGYSFEDLQVALKKLGLPTVVLFSSVGLIVQDLTNDIAGIQCCTFCDNAF